MEKNNKIFLIIMSISTILVVGVCIFMITNHENKVGNDTTSDAIKFKTEYEQLNGKIVESNKVYPTVTISENNSVKYLSEIEAVDLIENGTGVIYFGFSSCPWCRNIVNTLVSTTHDAGVTLYYLDVKDIRSSYEVVDGKLNKTKSGSSSYYKILKLLDSKLDKYFVADEDKNKYDTNEKRLYAPTIVGVKEGNITSIHVGTVDSQENPYNKLTDKQLVELNKKIMELIKTIETNTCTGTGC